MRPPRPPTAPNAPNARVVLHVLAVAAVGCSTFGAPTPRTRALLEPAPRLLPQQATGQLVVELATPSLDGEFDAVLAAPDARSPDVRLQVFPEVGGTLLEVAAGPDGVRGELGGVPYRAEPGLAGAAPHLCLLLGVALAEAAAPCTPDRLLGERSIGDGDGGDERVEVRLRPVLGGSTTARLDAAGRVLALRGRVGAMEWSIDRDGEVRAHGVRARLLWPP